MAFNLTEIGGISVFIERHTKLFLGIGLLFVAYFCYDKYITHESNVDKTAAQVAQAALAQQQALNLQLAASVKTAADNTAAAVAQYQAMVSALTAQNASLANAMAQRNQALGVQVGKNATLDSAGMASRMDALENLPLGSVVPNGDNVLLDSTASHQILDDLESVPVLDKNVKDLQTINDNLSKQLSSLGTVSTAKDTQIVACNNQVVGLQSTIVDTNKKAAADLAVANDNTKKARSRWFKIGFVTGFITGLVGGHYL